MMKDDLKNVIITLSLIGLAYTQGALMYQKKLLNDYILSKEVLPQASLNINDIQNVVSDPNLGIIKASTTKTTVKPAVSQTSNNSAALKAANGAELARIKAQLIAQQQEQALADQRAAQAAADAAAAQAQQAQYQSRQSRAS